MAIIVSTNGIIRLNNAGTSDGINGTDFSNHCRSFTVNDGQETREVTCHGETIRHYRAGIGTAAIEATFRGDIVAGSINQFLTNLITTTTSGVVSVYCRKDAAAIQGPSNPGYNLVSVLDGDFTVLNEEHGEVQEISCRFVPYSGSLSVVTTSSS